MIDEYTQKCLETIFDNFPEFNQKDFINFASEDDPEDKKYKTPSKRELILWYRERVKKDIGKQITKQRNYRIQSYKVVAVPGSYQMDLVFFYSDLPWLLIIHVPSRYAWLYPLLSKSKDEIYTYFKMWYYQNQKDQIEENERFVNTLTTDQESAFMSHKMMKFYKDHGIKYYVKDTSEHYPLVILDSAVRKLKRMLVANVDKDPFFDDIKIKFNNRSQVGKYIEKLDKIVIKTRKQYNRKRMKSLHWLSPIEVLYSEDYQNLEYKMDTDYNEIMKKVNDKEQNIKIGDYVRVKKRRLNKYEKARYFSDEVFRVIAKYRYSYQIGYIDEKTGEKIEVSPVSDFRYKPHELQKVSKDTKRSIANQLFSQLQKHKELIKQIHRSSRRSSSKSQCNQNSQAYAVTNKKLKSSFKTPTTVSTHSSFGKKNGRSSRNIKSNKSNDYVYY